jgi:hypothetical protein
VYRAEITPYEAITPGQMAQLKIKVFDEAGNPFTAYAGTVDSKINIAAVSRDLAYLASTSVAPPGGSGGGAPAASSAQASADAGVIQANLVFPAEAQYMVFLDFWTKMGSEVILAVPLNVGSAKTAWAALTTDAAQTQTAGDLKITLKTDAPLKANQFNYVSFDAVDAQGQSLAEYIQSFSGNQLQLDIVDEALTTYLHPEPLNRHKLQFSVNFPQPGKYKAWFTFRYGSQVRHLAYVIEVK